MSNTTSPQTPATPSGPPPSGQANFRIAGPDRRVITVGLVFAGTLLFFILMIASAIYNNLPPDIFYATIFLVVAGLMIYRYLFSVRGYTIIWGDTGPGDSRLVIRRVLAPFNIALPLNRLRFAYTAPNMGPLLNTSIMSQGTLFGWAGRATVAGYGSVEAYASNNRKAVVLEFSRQEGAWRRSTSTAAPDARGPIYVLSPADPEAFAAELRRLPGVVAKEEFKEATPAPFRTTWIAAPAPPPSDKTAEAAPEPAAEAAPVSDAATTTIAPRKKGRR